MADDAWVIDEHDRYGRLRLIAWWQQEKLARAKIMVVGAGALGNEVLKNLALLGVGQVYLVDFDHIEQTNLTRSVLFRHRDCGRPKAEAAAAAAQDINPDTHVVPMLANVMTDVGLGWFRDVDVVIGCLDNREARLWVNRCCWKVGTPWIDGGIQEINGVVKVFVPPESACYECGMTENDYRLINLRYSCPLLRQEEIQAGKVPTAPTISSMIGGLQTQEALKLIHGLPVESGQALVYNGVANRFYTTRFQRREDCMSHETYTQPLAVTMSAAVHSGRDLLMAASQLTTLDLEGSRIELDRDLVVAIQCIPCGTNEPVMLPLPLVGHRNAICPHCGQIARPDIVHTINAGSPIADFPLAQLGIPAYDIVRVASDTSQHFFLLADDCPRCASQPGGAGDEEVHDPPQ